MPPPCGARAAEWSSGLGRPCDPRSPAHPPRLACSRLQCIVLARHRSRALLDWGNRASLWSCSTLVPASRTTSPARDWPWHDAHRKLYRRQSGMRRCSWAGELQRRFPKALVVAATPRTAQAPPSTAPRARRPGCDVYLPRTRGSARDLAHLHQRPAVKRPESILLRVLFYSKSSSGGVTHFEHPRWSRRTAIHHDHGLRRRLRQ
jgi:hypothetical protein